MNKLTMLAALMASCTAFADEGSFGIVATVATEGLFPPKLDAVTVAEVVEGSSAARAGIVARDHVIAINGCLVPGCPASKAKKAMSKEVGEAVDLVVQKSSGEKLK